jgi:hypothetical protein
VAVRASLRAVLEHVSLAHVASHELPPCIADLIADPDAWEVRSGWRLVGESSLARPTQQATQPEAPVVCLAPKAGSA